MERTFQLRYTPADTDGGFTFGNMDSGYAATARYLTHNGQPVLPVCGEIHFSRCERPDWARELLKMKECGLTAVAVYVFWNHHERKRGRFRWDGNRDIAAFLRICREVGLQVILRIGPWCHGEARFGGFPDWLMPLRGKRRDTPQYLRYVERYWRALYAQVAEFCDGETILGIQLENEYTGTIDHIHTLRRIAEKAGFRVPYFTMTSWPTNTPDKSFLQMMGGYPEAPWTQHKRPLEPAGRFAICEGRTETEIGEDLIKGKRDKATFDDFPYMGCEVGTGNQVTQHRRPIISDRDGYGVAFAKFASGMNLMGYYMFHGGRNPRGELLQESHRTFYPNDYPIVDYDFQAPISKDGYCRRHGDRLRLLHLFIHTWDPDLARKQTFFSGEAGLPYSSVRCGEHGDGYLFVSNYERGEQSAPLEFCAKLSGDVNRALPPLQIAAGEMAFIPFRFQVRGLKFDYVTAQPVARVERGERTELYFVRMERQPAQVSVNGNSFTVERDIIDAGNGVTLHFMDLERALRFHLVDGEPVYCDGTMWTQGESLYALLEDGQSVTVHGQTHTCSFEQPQDAARLERTGKVKLPYDSYLYSRGERGYYRLTVRMDRLKEFDDAALDLRFRGLNLQVFCGGVLVDDYFNTDGYYRLHIRHFRELLEQNGGEIVIRTSAPTAHGIGHVYSEIEMKPGFEDLTLEKVRPIRLEQIVL